MTLQNISGRGLLLQRLGEIVGPLRNSLSSRVFSMAMTAWAAKFLHQLNLLVGERADFLAVNDEHADQFVFLEHRYHEQLCGRQRVRRLQRLTDRGRHTTARSEVCDMDRLLGLAEAGYRRYPGAAELAVAPQLRGVSSGDAPWSATLRKPSPSTEHMAELGLANPRRVREHSIEYRLQLAGRTTMTSSTSAVAVCCCNDSTQFV